MRLLVLFFLAGLMHVSAATYSQTVSLQGKRIALAEVLQTIRKQTGFAVYVNVSHLEGTKPITINAENMPLNQFLEEVLEGQPLEAKMEDKTIILSRKAASNRQSSLDQDVLLPRVRGRLLDSLGTPVVGATVTLLLPDQSTTGMIVVSDDAGYFEFRSVSRDCWLLVTSVGYAQRVVRISSYPDPLEIRIQVSQSQTKLEDVEIRAVNTGYQRIRPEQSTGAVSQISSREYESRVSTNFVDGLVNRLPGLMINNDINFTSTAPNGATNSRPLFNIRGISTMSANQSPLIVIDGYPTELTLDMLDPNEIESVTILKDAAAATVYGVRASNGVIVIEKKEAVAGAPRFNFRATAGIRPKEDYSRYRWADDASAIVVDYNIDRYSAAVNASSWDQLATNVSPTGGTVRRSPIYYILAQRAAGMITEEQAAQRFEKWRNYDNLEDYSDLFTRRTLQQTYNFNVSGGSANALYYVTANYIDNQTQQVGNSNNRFLLSARSTLKLSDRLSVELTTDYQEERFNSRPVPGVTGANPFERFRDASGNPAYLLSGSISPWYNAVMMADGLDDHLYYPLIDYAQVTDRDRTVNNRFNADFRYRILSGLNLSFGGVYETSRSEGRYYAGEESSVARRYINSYVVRNTDGSLQYNVPKGGYLDESTASISSLTIRGQLNYDKTLGTDHSINGIIGGEVQRQLTTGNRSAYFGYNDLTLLHQPVDLALLNRAGVTGTYRLGSPLQNAYQNLFNLQYVDDRYVSAYTNLVYSYRNTYSVSGSMRIDQSNLFGTNPKYKYKPLWSLGAAWNLHQEAFLQDLVWVNQLKIRTGYGFNGNVAKMSLPQVIAQARLNTYTAPFSPSLSLLSYANSSLRWEQTENLNVGLDYRLFRNVSGSVDYYLKKSTDLLGQAMIDPTIGVSPTLINQATIRNTGLEFSLRADWIATPTFNWNTGIVIGSNDSKVLDVFQRGSHNPEVRNAVGFVKDYPVGAMFAYRYAGLDSLGFPLVQDTEGNLYRTQDSRAGSPTTIIMSNDTSGVIRFMGTSIPKVNAGLSNRVDFGNFYVFAMVNYYGGFHLQVPRPNPGAERPLEGAGDYWKVPGDELRTDVQGLAAYASYNSNSAYNYADSYVVRGDYLTLGDLTVSYRMDDTPFARRIGLRNFEIKAQASNIWTVGFNEYNYSRATGSFQKRYMTPTYTLALFTNF